MLYDQSKIDDLRKQISEYKNKYETLKQIQHGRNWDDNEAEYKLNLVAERCKELAHKNTLLRQAIHNSNEKEEYFTYFPDEDNYLESLADDLPVHISAIWLRELIADAQVKGFDEGFNCMKQK